VGVPPACPTPYLKGNNMCERGDTVKCNVLGRGVMIDRCIVPIINALNECGLVTAERERRAVNRNVPKKVS